MKENLDRNLWKTDAFFCGIDEVGRGALAGPVVAAAVILPPGAVIPGADDSKVLSPRKRLCLDRLIRHRCLACAVGAAGHRYIDRYNIAAATFYAMRLAVRRLCVRPVFALADGWQVPELEVPCTGIVRGDQRSLSIACASIVAKVFRDRLMVRLAGRYPGYGFERHAGYGTARHLAALRQLGPSPIHRRTFAPVRRLVSPEAR